MASKPKLTDVVAVKVRIRGELWQMLSAEAKRRDISLNKEIERRLWRSFETDMNVTMFQLIADNAVDTAYSRIGLNKPSDMIKLVEAKLGNEAAKKFAATLADASARKEKDQ